jgi:NifU-like protein involved in Fe-S cluster formation
LRVVLFLLADKNRHFLMSLLGSVLDAVLACKTEIAVFASAYCAIHMLGKVVSEIRSIEQAMCSLAERKVNEQEERKAKVKQWHRRDRLRCALLTAIEEAEKAEEKRYPEDDTDDEE